MNQLEVDILVAQKNMSNLQTALDIAIVTKASRKEVNLILTEFQHQLDVIREARSKLPE